MTGRHPQGDLPGLLLGELAPATAIAVDRHLAGCDPCRRDLAAVAVAASALRDASRLPFTKVPDLPPPLRLPTAGLHNVANALGVAGAARAAGLGPEAIVAGLASFTGVGRRLERKGEARGVIVFDDYGHHPTAIRETIAAVRQRVPGRRVWAVCRTVGPDGGDPRREPPST